MERKRIQTSQAMQMVQGCIRVSVLLPTPGAHALLGGFGEEWACS